MDKNEKDINKLMHLGGGLESWGEINDGKKMVEGNINCKPSKYEELYNYDEDLELERRYDEEFPLY